MIFQKAENLINLNPRDTITTAKNVQAKLTLLSFSGDRNSLEKFCSDLDRKFISFCQNHAKNFFVDVDVDNPELLNSIPTSLSQHVISTYSGYHVIFRNDTLNTGKTLGDIFHKDR